ncbi:RNA methyltransferase [Crocinitomicaceae bacterium]|nr:RNA methyltransferase [Crocinitomicaceae bacterium]
MKKNRDKEGYFIIEGEKIGKECMHNISEDISLIGCLSSHTGLIPKNLLGKSFILSSKEFERVSSLKTPNKLILVIKKPSIILFNPDERFLILENIQDPGNFGTIIRTADWFGIHQIVCSPKNADVFNSKTLQASMGSFLRIKVYYKELVPFLEQSNYKVAGAFLDGEPLEDFNLRNSNAIMLGNEGKGISDQMEKFCNNPVKITGYGEAESLNVSIAASILIYEWTKKSKS